MSPTIAEMRHLVMQVLQSRETFFALEKNGDLLMDTDILMK